MDNKKSFLLYVDTLEILDKLSNEQKGILFNAIYKFHLGELVELDPLLDIAFSPFIAQFKRDAVKYEKVLARNRENGLLGGRPKSSDNQSNDDNPTKPSETQNNPVGFSETQQNPTEPKKPDSDSESVSESVNDSVSPKVINIDDVSIKFKREVFSFSDRYSFDMLEDFYYYWIEPSATKKNKLKFQIEKTWSTEYRLRTWNKRSKQFKPQLNGTKIDNPRTGGGSGLPHYNPNDMEDIFDYSKLKNK